MMMRTAVFSSTSRRLLVLSRSSICRRWQSSTKNSIRRPLSSVVRPLSADDDDSEDNSSASEHRRSWVSAALPKPAVAAQPKSIPRPIINAENKDKSTTAAEGGTGNEQQSSERVVIRAQTSPSHLVFTGEETMPVTSTLHIVTPEEDTPRGVWPIFRIMDEDGHFRDPTLDGYEAPDSDFHKTDPVSPKTSAGPSPAHDDLPGLRSWLQTQHPFYADEIEKSSLLHPAAYEFSDMATKNPLLRAHRQMLRLKEMDSLLQNAQRQGRISFYMTCRGEEAIHMGAASALDLGDVVLAQYREAGLLMWRGFSLEQFTNQCFSNDGDLGKGRQMPVHYGSRALNYQTISSPLGTQLPQATGAAYRLKLQKKPNIAACFFGDGAASTTDFHSALNFAATLNAPVVFICRNNGYAISTPVNEQYKSDGIVSRAPGYGMAGLRVDGNDIFAVHAAIREAKAYALEHSAPVLVECMTYRQGHHSTSDDSTRYRSSKEVQDHAVFGDPIVRLNSFLKNVEWINDETIHSIRNEEKSAVLQAMTKAEKRPPPPLEDLFEDVYHEVPEHLQWQKEQLEVHLAKYPEKYRSEKHH